MKTFLRHQSTGQYFQALNCWTPDRENAHDFGLLPRAAKVARKLKLRGLEVVLAFDNPGQVASTSFKDLWRQLWPMKNA